MFTKHRFGRWLSYSDDNDNVKNTRSDISQESAFMVTCSAAGDGNETANVTGTDTDAKKKSSPLPSLEFFSTSIIKNNISDSSTPGLRKRNSSQIALDKMVKLRNEDEKNSTCSDIVNGTAQKEGDAREDSHHSDATKKLSRLPSVESFPTFSLQNNISDSSTPGLRKRNPSQIALDKMVKLRNEDEKNTTYSEIAQKEGDAREGNTRSKLEKQRPRSRSLSLPARKTQPSKDERSNSTTDLFLAPQSKLTLSISGSPPKQRTAIISDLNRFDYARTEQELNGDDIEMHVILPIEDAENQSTPLLMKMRIIVAWMISIKPRGSALFYSVLLLAAAASHSGYFRWNQVHESVVKVAHNNDFTKSTMLSIKSRMVDTQKVVENLSLEVSKLYGVNEDLLLARKDERKGNHANNQGATVFQQLRKNQRLSKRLELVKKESNFMHQQLRHLQDKIQLHSYSKVHEK